MTLFISHLHDDLRRTRFTRRGATHAPEDVPRGKHKSYERMPRVSLAMPEQLDRTLADALGGRHSYMKGDPEALLLKEEWGTLLGLALKKRAETNSRNYPSGGALFPVETYVITRLEERGAMMALHYNPTEHALEQLWEVPSQWHMKDFARKPDDLLFSAIVVFTSIWKRSSAKYGDFTYTLALLEAGHMSENILLTATALGLKSRPMAGFNDERIVELLDLDTDIEQPVHSIVLSK